MKKSMKTILNLLPFFYMLLIWYLSGKPHNHVIELPDSSIDRFLKESLHLVEFGILYILFAVNLLVNDHYTVKSSIIFALIAGLYGIVDEVHQSFVPYRSATLIDAVKDITGVIVAWWVINRAVSRGKFKRFHTFFLD